MLFANKIEIFPSGRVELKRCRLNPSSPSQQRRQSNPAPEDCSLNNIHNSRLFSESDTSNKSPILRPGFGLPCIPSLFTWRANRIIYEACSALEKFDKANTYLLTCTLPADTEHGISAFEDWSGYALNKLTEFIGRSLPNALYVRVLCLAN